MVILTVFKFICAITLLNEEMQYCCYMTFPKSVCILIWKSFSKNYTEDKENMICYTYSSHKQLYWLHIILRGFIDRFFVRFALSLSLLSLNYVYITSLQLDLLIILVIVDKLLLICLPWSWAFTTCPRRKGWRDIWTLPKPWKCLTTWALVILMEAVHQSSEMTAIFPGYTKTPPQRVTQSLYRGKRDDFSWQLQHITV